MDKEIIVLLVIGVLAILTAAFTLLAAYKRDQKLTYVHTKTGNRYRVIQECKMKYDGKWMDAIAYISEKDSEMYVREYNDFVGNFKRLSEWKEN